MLDRSKSILSCYTFPLLFQGFQNLIQDWPSDLYNIQTVVNAVLDKLDKEYRNSPALLKCLGEL